MNIEELQSYISENIFSSLPTMNTLANKMWDIFAKLIELTLLFIVLYIAYKVLLKSYKIILNKKLSSVKVPGMDKKEISDQKRIEERRETLFSIMKDLTKYVFSVLTLILSLFVIGIDPALLATSTGVIAVVLGIAGQELIKDFINGMFNVYEGYYDVGDYIKIETLEGTVVHFGVKSTTLLTYSNEKITIPNSQITKIINYSRMDYIYLLDFPISYKENLYDVENVINKTLIPRIEKNKFVSKATYKGIQELSSSTINLRIEITCKPEERFNVKRFVTREVKIVWDENKIEIPFNQLVVHNS